jgi:group I intron endonuclease
MTGIYKITSPTGKVYIGQAVDINRRLKSYANGSCINQPKVYNSISKYSWQQHIVEILEECDEEALNKLERYWQDYYNSVEQGLNSRYTATDEKSGRLSQEVITKLRKPKSNTEKMKKPKSAEHVAKITAATKGKKRGHQKNPSNKKGAAHWKYGKKYPELSSKRIGDKNPAARSIEVYSLTGDYIRTYGTQTEAMRDLNFNHTGGISSCCRGKVKSYLGYIFKYAK